MPIAPTWEPLYKAVCALAAGPGDIDERLTAAAYRLVVVPTVEIEELPQEIQSKFQELLSQLTASKPVGDMGRTQVTVDTFSPEKATEAAEKIVNLYTSVTEWKEHTKYA